MSVLRDIDPVIVKAVRDAPLALKGKYIDTVALAQTFNKMTVDPAETGHWIFIDEGDGVVVTSIPPGEYTADALANQMVMTLWANQSLEFRAAYTVEHQENVFVVGNTSRAFRLANTQQGSVLVGLCGFDREVTRRKKRHEAAQQRVTGISHEYLRARLRHMRGRGVLGTALSSKIRWGKDPLPAEVVINAWRVSDTVAGAARMAGLSRSGVLQRIDKLRKAVGDGGALLYPDLRDRPHQAVTEEARQAALLEEIEIGAAG